MTYWEFQGEGTPKIIAHISGASHYFEADKLDFIAIPTQERASLKNTTQWEQDIEERRKQVYHAVLTNNTQEQMKDGESCLKVWGIPCRMDLGKPTIIHQRKRPNAI